MEILLLQRQAQAVGQQCRHGSGQDHGSQGSVSSDTGPGDIMATSAWAPHPPSSCAEGRLRPAMPPKAVPSSEQRGADPGLVLEGGRVKRGDGGRMWRLGRARRWEASQDWEPPETGGEGGHRE